MKNSTSSYNWKKRGLIIKPQKNLGWMQTHAMLPTVDYLQRNIYRVYFSGRDKYNRSHIGYAVIEINDVDLTVIEYSKEPVLSPGALGCFDDSGVTPSSIITVGDKKYFYYIGWNQRSRVRMSLIAGLAVSTNRGKTFFRHSPAPLFERTAQEPISILTAPHVLREGKKWRMWYVSGIEWVNEDLPRYNIKYAEGDDGIKWERTNHVCIDFISPQETALARPYVIRLADKFVMWYSYKGKNYRIGYAESNDGLSWRRLDKRAGITVSKTGWDSKMVEYACVFTHNECTFMLYNGNDYSKDGIGYAILENFL